MKEHTYCFFVSFLYYTLHIYSGQQTGEVVHVFINNGYHLTLIQE